LILGNDHPFNLDELGNEKSVREITIEDLRKIHSYGYTAKNMQLILVGNLPEDSEELVKRYFDERPSGKDIKYVFPYKDSIEEKIILHTSAPDLLNKDNPLESNSTITLCVLVSPSGREDTYGISMISSILGGGMLSKIYQELSQKRGLAYRIGSQYNGSNNLGTLEIKGNVLSHKQDEAIEIIFEEFRKLKESPLPEEELRKLKKNMHYRLNNIYDTNYGHIRLIRNKLDNGITPEIIYREYNNLTPEKIQELAQKYLPSDRTDDKYALLIRDPLKK